MFQVGIPVVQVTQIDNLVGAIELLGICILRSNCLAVLSQIYTRVRGVYAHGMDYRAAPIHLVLVHTQHIRHGLIDRYAESLQGPWFLGLVRCAMR